MRYSDQAYNLRIETDSGSYTISPEERQKLDSDLDILRKAVAQFPVSDLKVELTRQQPDNIRAAMSLRLPGTTLYAADHDRVLHPAWERALRRLVYKVRAYKDRLENKPTYTKEAQGTLHDVRPALDPDANELQRAVDELDYVSFRRQIDVYDEALQGRVGRWVQRYPKAEERLGNGMAISEIVEEVYVLAFERFNQRPPLRLGEWLEELIDPAVRNLLDHPAEEKENLSFLASAEDALREREQQNR